MKSRGNKTKYLAITGLLIVAIAGYFLSLKSDNERLNTLTENLKEKSIKSIPKLKEIIEKRQQVANSNSQFPLPPGVNLLTRERIYTESEINNMTAQGFEEMLADVERRMPKKSDLQKIPAEALHTTPAIIIEAGRNLGALKEVLNVHETYELQALPFYKKCSLDNERPTTVRALCFTNLVYFKKKNNEKINLAEYPSDIVKLSKLVTDL